MQAQRVSCRRDDLLWYELRCAEVVVTGMGERGELLVRTPQAEDRAEEAGLTLAEGMDEEEGGGLLQMDVADARLLQRMHEIHMRVGNKLGHLLLPPLMDAALLGDIETHFQTPALLLYDTEGRVHQITFVFSGLFLLLMPLWHPPRLETCRVKILALRQEAGPLRLEVDGLPVTRGHLFLPPNCPEDFLQWRPELEEVKEYDVCYCVLSGRLYSLTHPQGELNFTHLWESRFH